MDKVEEFEARIKVDPNDLDNELIEMPELIYHAHVQHALAVSRRDKLKEQLRGAEAAYAAQRRESGEKITEAQIKREIEDADEFYKARLKLIDEQALVSRWDGIRSAFQARKFMLHDLTELTLARLYTKQAVDEQDVQRRMQAGRRRIREREKL